MTELFLRIDKDGVPDERSYYDVNGGKSRFTTKEDACYKLYKYYVTDDDGGLEDWLDSHVIETAPGVWGLPTEPNVLFGYLFNSKGGYITFYMKPNYYFQIFEGIPVNDYNPVRAASYRDGDQFIPVKLLHSWRIPNDRLDMEWVRLLDKVIAWQEAGIINSNPPWELINDIRTNR